MAESQNQSERQTDDPGASPDQPPRVINADDLFQGAREVCLDLVGVRYRLRITRRNKLILQK